MNSPKSILFVLPARLSASGGVNQVVINLARETIRHGQLRPIIFYTNPAQTAFQESESEGIKVITGNLGPPLAGGRPGRSLAAFAHGLREDMRTWRDLIRKHNIVVVNAHDAGLNYSVFSLLRARRAKFRLLFSLHGADVTAFEESGVAVRPFARWMLNKADSVVCCSDDLAKRAQSSLKLDKGRLTTIHNGIDVAELNRAKGHDYRPPIADFDSYLISVADYEHHKGQDILLRAYTTLLREGLKSALVLIGRRTDHLQQLRALARQLGLQEHVFFIPDLPHMQTLSAIRHARLLVQPSRDEAFGIPLLEAGYLGTPIVAARTGGIPEVLGGYYPYLAKPDDPAALASAIDDALFNPTETRQQIKLMKRRVATGFTWGTAYSAYESAWSSNTD